MDALDEVDADDDVDAELDVDTLEKKFLVCYRITLYSSVDKFLRFCLM